MQFCDIRITKEPLDAAPSLFSRTEGAVVDFFGVVRTVENERMIDGIEYEAFEAMAERQLALIADEARERHGLVSVIIHHRIGFVRLDNRFNHLHGVSSTHTNIRPCMSSEEYYPWPVR